jgi:hypothetical protein
MFSMFNMFNPELVWGRPEYMHHTVRRGGDMGDIFVYTDSMRVGFFHEKMETGTRTGEWVRLGGRTVREIAGGRYLIRVAPVAQPI